MTVVDRPIRVERVRHAIDDARLEHRHPGRLPLPIARAAGERGRIVSALVSQAGLAHLVEVQYVTKQPQSERKTLYVITDRGRQALANTPQ